MPAHEFAWPGDVRVPTLQAYGTKRKAPPVEGQQHVDEFMEDVSAAKRLCPSGPLAGAGDEHMSMDTPMENNNNLTSLHPDGPQLQQWHQKSQLHNGAVPWQQQQQQQQATSQPGLFPQQSVGGIMDISGETFSHQRTRGDSQDALMSMDSDCVPDSSQYNLPEGKPRESSDDSQSTYCDEYCGLGDRSPTTSRVRCYCKPSWEGMLSMRPYISDIY